MDARGNERRRDDRSAAAPHRDDPRHRDDAGLRDDAGYRDDAGLRDDRAVDTDRGSHRARDVDDRDEGRRHRDERDLRDRDDDRDDDRLARPAHAGAGPAAAVGRSSTWGPVLSGTATAFVVFLIFSALWLAIAASGVEAVGQNLEWFQLATALFAAAAGGAAAGWLDPRGTTTGLIQGIATWGLLLFAVAIAGVATGTALLAGVADLTLQAGLQDFAVADQLRPFENELWALFAVLVGGALVAGLAGAATSRTHTMLALDDARGRDGHVTEVDLREEPARGGDRSHVRTR